MGKISVIISVVKEDIKDLPRALSSIKKFASEIVIIDMTGSEEIVDVVKKYNAKRFKHKLVAYVEIVRNFGISKTSGKWVLVVDPDEEIPHELSEKLVSISCGNSAFDYYRLPRKNIIFGKWIKHSRWWPDYNIRFFKKDSVSWNEEIHSVPSTEGEGCDLEPFERNAIVHYHYKTIEQYIHRMNRYTSAQSRGLVKNGYKFDWKDLIKKPSAEFISRFFQSEAYKDGIHGFALAFLQAFSEFVVYLKIWQNSEFSEIDMNIEKFIKVTKEVESELNYWRADALIKKKGGLGQRIKRKFKLP